MKRNNGRVMTLSSGVVTPKQLRLGNIVFRQIWASRPLG
ncbi:uncharacterized protein G2W53_003649 [Senna tora]|uniref:Uncharacterized protein n=1 Tax=Senna tora TaxID=362788 RepID=A0A835CH80_9FABA|nr:uncharacterized protein G2W53_003649 [Senna tora]